MAGRRTNLALLALLLAALASGFTSFALGTKATMAVVIGHGVVSLGIILLAPWKTGVARRSIRRRGWKQTVSFALVALTGVALLTGVLQVSGLVTEVGPVTIMQIHVGSGIGAVVAVLAHTIMRPVKVHRVDLSRRNLLRGAALLGLAGTAYLALNRVWDLLDAPGAKRRFTGSHEVGSEDPMRFPTTQWLNDQVPLLDPDSFQVRVLDGDYTSREIAAFGDSINATLDCTGGWFTTQNWQGASLDRFIKDGVGRSILVRSVTGYWRRFPIDQAERLLLATHIAGEPLTRGHGSPVRLVAPGRRGFWWVKWVDTVTIDEVPPWWQPPLPTA